MYHPSRTPGTAVPGAQHWGHSMTARRTQTRDNRRRQSMSSGAIKLGGYGLVAVLVLVWLSGVDLSGLARPQYGGFEPPTPAEAEAAAFSTALVDNAQSAWGAIFRDQVGARFAAPDRLLFSHQPPAQAACDGAAVGVTYCPADQRLYLNTAALAELQARPAPDGDLAVAYAVAHHMAHHVQVVLDALPEGGVQPNAAQEWDPQRLNLRADCLAGVSAQKQAGLLTPQDAARGLAMLMGLGDRAGSSAQAAGAVALDQRLHWFVQGLEGGRVDGCDSIR